MQVAGLHHAGAVGRGLSCGCGSQARWLVKAGQVCSQGDWRYLPRPWYIQCPCYPRSRPCPQHAHPSVAPARPSGSWPGDRKSTRLNSSHLVISYAVFCLKKKMLVPADAPLIEPDMVSIEECLKSALAKRHELF